MLDPCLPLLAWEPPWKWLNPAVLTNCVTLRQRAVLLTLGPWDRDPLWAAGSTRAVRNPEGLDVTGKVGILRLGKPSTSWAAYFAQNDSVSSPSAIGLGKRHSQQPA